MIRVQEPNRTVEERFYDLLIEYGALEIVQLKKYFPYDDELFDRIIRSLEKKGRLVYEKKKKIVKAHNGIQVDEDQKKCFWIVIDLMDQIEFHCVGRFPLMLLISAKAYTYEVYYVKVGDELAMSHVINYERTENDKKEIIVIEEEFQMEKILVEDAIFCLINNEGEVTYYERYDAV